MRVAFPTDEHRPFHDGRAIDLAMQIIRDFDPELMIVGSDGIDFYAVSHFDKNPIRGKDWKGLQTEINSWKSGQRAWRDVAPHATRRFLPGNHDDRLRKWLWSHPEIADLDNMKFPALLDFVSLGIEWDGHDYETSEIVLHNRVVYKHGKYVRKGSAMSAKAELDNEKHSISTITGHTHRGGMHLARTRRGVVQAYEAYCLCRLDPEYVSRPDWHHGTLLVDVTSTTLSVEPVTFFPYKGKEAAIWRGKLYTA